MKNVRRLFAILVFVGMSLMANAQEGAWSGEIEVQGMKLPLVFNFGADGCTLDSPSQGAKGIKAEKETLDGGKIRVKIPMAMATFDGTMDGNSIMGTFMQN